jgi:hypothetical protein
MPSNNPALPAVRTGLQIAHPWRDCFYHLYVHNLLLKVNMKVLEDINHIKSGNK